MTEDGKFKKVVRRRARETGQRYTEALEDLEGVERRLFHAPSADRVLSHLRDRYGPGPTAVTAMSRHNNHVFRIDRGAEA
ncbi:MAG: hypothetical protein AAF480_19835, partial [Actinomycetota bacterium]